MSPAERWGVLYLTGIVIFDSEAEARRHSAITPTPIALVVKSYGGEVWQLDSAPIAKAEARGAATEQARIRGNLTRRLTDMGFGERQIRTALAALDKEDDQ